jgi:hypothetical protein
VTSALVLSWLAGCSASTDPPDPSGGHDDLASPHATVEPSAEKSKGEAPPTDDSGLSPLATVDTEEGTRITFYEPIPGYGLFAVETGGVNGAAHLRAYDEAGLTVPQMFAELVPDEPMPETMLAVDRRAQEYTARLALDPKAIPDLDSWTSPDPKSTPSFRQRRVPGVKPLVSVSSGAGCSVDCSAFTEDMICSYNMTGDAAYRRDDIDIYSGQVCAVSGTWVRWRVSFRTWWSWSTYGDYTIRNGNWYYITNGKVAPVFDFDVSGLVFDVYPDSFHQAHYFW